MKKGTTMSSASHMTNKANSGIRHGPSNKNVKATGKMKGKPSGPTSPIKGSDRGGV